jgi:hypothetical protein
MSTENGHEQLFDIPCPVAYNIYVLKSRYNPTEFPPKIVVMTAFSLNFPPQNNNSMS